MKRLDTIIVFSLEFVFSVLETTCLVLLFGFKFLSSVLESYFWVIKPILYTLAWLFELLMGGLDRVVPYLGNFLNWLLAFCWIGGHVYIIHVFPKECLNPTEFKKHPDGYILAHCQYCHKQIEQGI